MDYSKLTIQNFMNLLEFVEGRFTGWYVVFAMAFIVTVSLYSLAFFLSNRIYLVGSDIFYYLSIADSILDTGKALVPTTDPASALKTPQNGIVLIHLILAKLGLGAERRLVSITVINYLAHISAVFPLYKISRRMGIRSWLGVIALMAVYLAAFHVYRMQLLPINDGIFNAASVWLTYLLIVVVDDFEDWYRERGLGSTKLWVTVAVLVLLAGVIVQFRINGAIVVFAGLVAAVAVRKFGPAICALLAFVSSLLSVGLFYLLTIDRSHLNEETAQAFEGFASRLVSNAFHLVTEIIPFLLLVQLGKYSKIIGPMFVVVIALSICFLLLSGYKSRRGSDLVVALSLMGGILFLELLYFQHHRLLIYILPLIALVLLSARYTYTRVFGYGLAGLIVLSSVVTFYRGFDQASETQFWAYIKDSKISLPEDEILLITERDRHSYFFLSTPATRQEISIDMILARKSVFIVGDSTFRAKTVDQLKEVAQKAGFKFDVSSLTPGYRDLEGHEIIVLSNFARVLIGAEPS